MRFGAAAVLLALAPLVSGCGAPDETEPLGFAEQPLAFMPYLPYPEGVGMGVSQGWGGTYSHTGNLYYAIDFNQAGSGDRGIHILSVGDGTVSYRYDSCSCDGCDCNYGWGNAVVIDHGNGEASKYTHLEYNSIPGVVQVGADACRGLFIGTLGSTGNSTGPHLHFQFQDGGGLGDASIPFDRFFETSGVPQEGGGPYVSQNQERSDCSSCNDQCVPGELRCDGNDWQECDYFDSDPCLDWGGGASCDPGTHCEGDGECVPDDPADGGAGGVGGAGVGGDGFGGGGTGASGAAGAGGDGPGGVGGGGLDGLGVESSGIVGECSCRVPGAPRSESGLGRMALLAWALGVALRRRRAWRNACAATQRGPRRCQPAWRARLCAASRE